MRSSPFVWEADLGEDVVGLGWSGGDNKTFFFNELEHMFIVFKRILVASLPYP